MQGVDPRLWSWFCEYFCDVKNSIPSSSDIDAYDGLSPNQRDDLVKHFLAKNPNIIPIGRLPSNFLTDPDIAALRNSFLQENKKIKTKFAAPFGTLCFSRIEPIEQQAKMNDKFVPGCYLGTTRGGWIVMIKDPASSKSNPKYKEIISSRVKFTGLRMSRLEDLLIKYRI